MQEYHSLDRVPDSVEIESLLLKQKEHDIEQIATRKKYPDLPKFSPSSMNKCDKTLYRIANKLPVPRLELYPYNRRWTRAGSAVHEYSQRDLLYMEKVLPNPRFIVKRTADGMPYWERNVATYKEFTHKGQTFLISGMLDGMLIDTVTGKDVLWEKKTKSTTVAQTGEYLMKDVQSNHVLQGVAYSCLFMGDPYEDRTDIELFEYENLARDNWSKGADAKPDLRTFQKQITLEDRIALLDRLAYICSLKEEPEDCECSDYFCEYHGASAKKK